MNDNMRKFVRGLMVSTVSKGALPKKREPVAYLYNSVGPLPDIFKVYTPELQKTHPFAVITYFIGYYYLYLFTDDVLYCKDGGMFVKQDTTLLRSILDKENTKWGNFEESFYSVSGWGPLPRWSNFNVLNEDGSVYLAASDPIPVYE